MSAFFYSTLVFLLTCSASADKPPAGSRPAAFFSDGERQAMSESGSFEYRLVEKDGVRVPRVNGRGLMGINAQFSNADPRQARYEAPILAQQGINNVKLGLRPAGWGWKQWVPIQDIFQRVGISTIWSGYAMCYEDQYFSRLLELPEGALKDTDKAIMEDGKRDYFKGMGTLGNMFSSEFQETCRKVIDHARGYLDRYSTVIGYQYTNEVQFKTGSYDPKARRNWQDFLKFLFKDATPAADTNGDGACFNRTFAASYQTWDEVNQFRGGDWKDHRKALLRDAWIGLRYARYLDALAWQTRKGNPNLLVGPMICVPLSPTVDLSLMLSMPNVNASFINTYFCWLGNGLLCEGIADTYRKPTVASEIGMPHGNYQDVKWGGLTHLPYLEGYQWFTYSMQPKEAGGEHGGKYGLVDRWTINAMEDRSDEFTEPYKVVEYNSRFAIIPQLAPFVGRLHAGHNRRILWVSAAGYPRDWLEDHHESCIMRADVTSDIALALAPKPLDLSGYRVIIYRNLQSPCISKDIYRRLKDFVAAGGTVITGAYFIAADGTWLGEDNRRDWWQGMKLVREAHSDAGTTDVRYGAHEIRIKGTFQYLFPDGLDVHEAGQIKDSSGATYPFLLTRREGKGQWVYVNAPYFFQVAEPYEPFSAEKYRQRFDCLRDVVFDCSGQMPADRYGTQWYSGEDCVLAIREKFPGSETAKEAAPTGVSWPNGKYVMFDTFALRTEGDAPYVEVSGNRLKTTHDPRPGETKLWVVKPYGRPVVLYADGTLKNQARIDSGVYSAGWLKFRFAQRIFISSPARPSSVTVDGKQHPYSYDERTKLLKINREGLTAEAEITY